MKQRDAMFVFGSNEAGHHGAGAAAAALANHGAEYGQGFGPAGDSFAIPTMDWMIRPLPLEVVAVYVARFLAYAREAPTFPFAVTRIACGRGGRADEEIAPLFKGAPKNVHLPLGWRAFNGEPESA
jgi:hypothetical protein